MNFYCSKKYSLIIENDRCKIHLKLFKKKTLRIVLFENLVIWIKVLTSDSETDQTFQYDISEDWILDIEFNVQKFK